MTQANSDEPIPYQPVLWRVFTNFIDKNRKEIILQSQNQFLTTI